MNLKLQKPIGVFDAGIGSFAIAELIRKHYPSQDILYFADRASFPYGAKTKAELSLSISRAINKLTELGASAIVLASNAPSVVVLHDLRPNLTIPVLGIFPPVAEAIAASTSKYVAVLGVKSMVDSAEMVAYIAHESTGGLAHAINASSLVELVETGKFLTDAAETQREVNQFMADVKHKYPLVDTCTLSSTHLPWLAQFFERAATGMRFLDPAEKVIGALAPYVFEGTGQTICIATESAENPVSVLRSMFKTLGISLEPRLLANEG